jgi:hypothetical protein
MNEGRGHMPDRTAREYKIFVGWPEEFSEIPVGHNHGALTELHSNGDTALEIALTDIGEARWEVTSTLPARSIARLCGHFLFKRPKTQATRKGQGVLHLEQRRSRFTSSWASTS